MFTVAIIEDDRYFAEMLQKRILNEKRLTDQKQIEIFDTPSGFLQEITSGKHYDLCFLDVQMPEMDGILTRLLYIKAKHLGIGNSECFAFFVLFKC